MGIRAGRNVPGTVRRLVLRILLLFQSPMDTASIEFAKTREDWEKDRVIRRYSLKKYAPFDAGYIPRKEAKMLIYKGLLLFAIFWPSSRY